jgi:hypothetical protein
LRCDIKFKTAAAFLFLACSLFANTASFAGYIQATNSQDFAFLSSSIGDNSFKVTFSSAGQIEFSYFAGSDKENATINLVDNNIFADLNQQTVLAGIFNVTDSAQPAYSFTGSLFVLPALSYTGLATNMAHPLSEVVPGDAIVAVSSLLPVTVYSGCPYCGITPPVNQTFNSGPFLNFGQPFDVPGGDFAPEPSTAALFGISLLGAAAFRLKRSQYFKPKP